MTTLPLRPDPSAPADFDFIIGRWEVHHRLLKERLAGCDDWVEFRGESMTRKILGGFGNLEDNFLALPEGDLRAVALRSFDVKTAQWSIWWLDGRNPHALDAPVVGGFTQGVGTFYSDDQLNGRPIRVRFTWSSPASSHAHWEQAFSADAGATWETNWTMDFKRQPDEP